MVFVNLSLLAGGVLVAIPVVLHLIMRQKPRQLVFPALRFIQLRRIANQRRLQLRHWILLALRCLAIALLALALARPSVASAAMSNWIALSLLTGGFALVALLAVAAAVQKASKYLTGGLAAGAGVLAILLLVAGVRALAGNSPVLGDQEAPVAAVIVVDTAPRMQYRQDNQSRLELARETALWLVRQLPADSEVAVADARPGSGAFAVDRAAAEKNIERLRPTGTPRPLPEVITAAVNLAKNKPQLRKEVYVLTDLARAAWQSPAAGDLTRLLASERGVLVYVIDVGAEKPRNFALGDLSLSSEVLAPGNELAIETPVIASGAGGSRTVEVQIEEADPTLPIIRDGKPVLPKAIRRGSQEVKLAAGESQTVRFVLRGLAPGVHQGLVRLVGEDGLALDDVRYFTAEVQPAWPVLIVAPAGVSPNYLAEALAPRELRETGQARFRCDTLDQARLAGHELSDYRAVALVDPAPLTPDVWTKLAEYADRGGGVAIFLGHNSQPVASFQDPAAIGVLGGKLTRQTRSSGDLFLAPRSYEHPITAAFRQIEANVPWDRFPVYYHWNLDELAPTARTIIPYGNGKPALVEQSPGPRPRADADDADFRPCPPGRPLGVEPARHREDAWPCFVLVNEMLLYAVGSGQVRLNLHAGETAVLPNDEAEFPVRYELFTPLEQPQDVQSRDGRVTVRFTDNPGAYRLRGQKNGPIIRGFAVNLAGETSDLTRLKPEELDELLGQGRYHLARDRTEIDRAVGKERIGSEFYPLLVSLRGPGSRPGARAGQPVLSQGRLTADVSPGRRTDPRQLHRRGADRRRAGAAAVLTPAVRQRQPLATMDVPGPAAGGDRADYAGPDPADVDHHGPYAADQRAGCAVRRQPLDAASQRPRAGVALAGASGSAVKVATRPGRACQESRAAGLRLRFAPPATRNARRQDHAPQSPRRRADRHRHQPGRGDSSRARQTAGGRGPARRRRASPPSSRKSRRRKRPARCATILPLRCLRSRSAPRAMPPRPATWRSNGSTSSSPCSSRTSWSSARSSASAAT